MLYRVEDAALVKPRGPNDCAGCLEMVALARRILWVGMSKPGDALIGERMPVFLMRYLFTGGADAGHRTRIVQEQVFLFRTATKMLLACDSPDLKDLAYWYLYVATVPMPLLP